MRNSHSFKIFTLLLTLALLCTGCGQKANDQPAASAQSAVFSAPAVSSPESPASSAAEDPETPDNPTETPADEAPSFTFGDLAHWYFYFSSGAGGWHTEFTVDADGSFSGFYQDSDMGDIGSDYPNGTVYFSAFSGRFTEPQPVSDTAYVFQLQALIYETTVGTEEIRDGIHYIYTDAYGLTDAQDLYLYLPGSPIAALPDYYRSWVGYYDLSAVSEKELPFYGLYNEAAETGFSSYPTETAAQQAQRILSEAQAEDDVLENQLQNDASLTQGDMNLLSQQRYKVWDKALNDIWGLLKANLDGDTMQTLTAEQLQWISEKEAAVKETAAENQGGSLSPLLANTEAAERTKERSFALAAYLT